MFEKLLNQKVQEFIKRAFMDSYIKMNTEGVYYVKYFQERLYWLYDYDTHQTTMIYANSPSEAKELYEEGRK